VKKKKIYYRIDCRLLDDSIKYFCVYDVFGLQVIRLVGIKSDSIYYTRKELENIEHIIIDNMKNFKIQSYNFKRI
jgi:hypothetical protein